MKKRILCTLITAAILAPSSGVMAGQDVKVKINGEQLNFDVPPVIMNDRTMVPLRAVFEALDYEVNWQGETGTVTAVNENMSVTMQIDNPYMNLLDEFGSYELYLDSEPVIVNDRTLVPLRAISETSGYDVEWNGDERTVEITKPENEYDFVWNKATGKVQTKNETYALNDFFTVYNSLPQDNLAEYVKHGLKSSNPAVRYFSAYILTTIPEAHGNEEYINLVKNMNNSEVFTGREEDYGYSAETMDETANLIAAILSDENYSCDDNYLYTKIGDRKMWKIGCNYVGYESLWIRNSDGTIITTGMNHMMSIYDYKEIPGTDYLMATVGGKRVDIPSVINMNSGKITMLGINDEVERLCSEKFTAMLGKEIEFYLRNNEYTVNMVNENTFDFVCMTGDWGCTVEGRCEFDFETGQVKISDFHVEITDVEAFSVFAGE